jgi:1-acyl-sn-glycerol-3-phosphate acyltransferase
MPRSFAKRAWYAFIRAILWTAAFTLFRLRCHGRERLPATGGYLLLSNHQSFLDPPLVGLVVPRRVNFLARQTLFRNRIFAWFISSLDAIPIDRDGIGLSGLKETLRRLKRGEIVLLFPEGTRSVDGELQSLKPGFSALAQRAGVPLVPIALDGAQIAFAKGAKFPRPAVIHLAVGEPISAAEAESLDDRALVELVHCRLKSCHAAARRQRELASDGS